VFIYNELLIFSALVGIYIYVLSYAVYGQSPSIGVLRLISLWYLSFFTIFSLWLH